MASAGIPIERPAKRRHRGLSDCREERHLASGKVTIDASGVENCRCRVCGCELRRMPALRRWFRSGMMG
ncbi:hypothetical protein [Novosphingobium sp. Leaf2]|uniref:hypothetical protein n=1 Tax=Novosphingobium sp. Leaf2 TaxID=1735670 RepID=UPI0012E1C4D1|nr:hypothetical protein [Novosphingobium sp. Leaf2]